MKGLTGVLSATNLSLVRDSTKLRFVDASQFTTPEALIVYEQNMLDDKRLLSICSAEYGTVLQTPTPQYVPKELAEEFRGRECVPIRYDTREEAVYVGVLPEKQGYIPDVRNLTTKRVEVPIYYYVALHTRYYGRPSFLFELPAVDKLNMILDEAISLRAADITITNVAEGAQVYYNIRKKKVMSKRSIERTDVEQFAELLAARAKQPLSNKDNHPRYLSVQLDMHHRGRVVLNRTYYGRAITIRILSDDVLTESLEDLNLAPNACEFIRSKMLSREKGLRR